MGEARPVISLLAAGLLMMLAIGCGGKQPGPGPKTRPEMEKPTEEEGHSQKEPDNRPTDDPEAVAAFEALGKAGAGKAKLEKDESGRVVAIDLQNVAADEITDDLMAKLKGL